MKIIRKYAYKNTTCKSCNMNSFKCDVICEHCTKVVHNLPGYNNSTFYQKTLKNMKCPMCGKSSNEVLK